MEKVNIEWLKGSVHYSQIYSHGVEFCLASGKNEQSNHLAFCKDYLQDVYFATLNKKKVSIYGLNWHPDDYPNPDLDNLRIIVAEKGQPIIERTKLALEFVNMIAKRMHIKRTNLVIVNNPKKGYPEMAITIGSQIWMHAPPLLSLYSLLLRVGFSHTAGDKPEKTLDNILNGKLNTKNISDAASLKTIWKTVEKIESLGYRKFFYIDPKKNYPESLSASQVHNSTGIMGLAGDFNYNYNNMPVKYWSRKSLQKS